MSFGRQVHFLSKIMPSLIDHSESFKNNGISLERPSLALLTTFSKSSVKLYV